MVFLKIVLASLLSFLYSNMYIYDKKAGLSFPRAK